MIFENGLLSMPLKFKVIILHVQLKNCNFSRVQYTIALELMFAPKIYIIYIMVASSLTFPCQGTDCNEQN